MVASGMLGRLADQPSKRKSMPPKELIINFTPTGMVPTKKHSSYVPLSVTEIVEEIHMACDVGITTLHLHARDPDTSPTNSPEVYAEIIEGIRRFAPELVICVSLSVRIDPSFERRSQALFLEGGLKPDMGSLTLSSLNFPSSASKNAPGVVKDLASCMQKRGILPELQIFDVGMANYARYLIDKGLVQTPCYANIIVGNIASVQLELDQLGAILNHLPEQCFWALGGIGDYQLSANALAIAMQGGVRVGLEDNLFWDTGRTQLASNKMLLQRTHQLAEIHQRKVMSSKTFRKALGLRPGFGEYGTAAAQSN